MSTFLDAFELNRWRYSLSRTCSDLVPVEKLSGQRLTHAHGSRIYPLGTLHRAPRSNGRHCQRWVPIDLRKGICERNESALIMVKKLKILGQKSLPALSLDMSDDRLPSISHTWTSDLIFCLANSSRWAFVAWNSQLKSKKETGEPIEVYTLKLINSDSSVSVLNSALCSA